MDVFWQNIEGLYKFIKKIIYNIRVTCRYYHVNITKMPK